MKNEAEEGIEKVQEALKVCSKYKEVYHDRQNNLAEYFKEGPVVEWSFQSALVFSRFDKFVNQLHVIEVIKLERERERERERQTDRQTETDRQGETDRDRQTHRQRQTDTQTVTEKERQRERQREREGQRERERESDREAETETERWN